MLLYKPREESEKQSEKPKKRRFGKSYVSKAIEKTKKMIPGEKKSLQLRDVLISNLSKALYVEDTDARLH